jgi:hypothetical protein
VVIGRAATALRAREPMSPMRFFRSRTFTAGNAAVFFRGSAIHAMATREGVPYA